MRAITRLFTSDAELVRGALSRSPEAFEELVFRYQKKAHAIARALGVPSSTIDDVVQEAFLSGLRHLSELRAPEAFGPWFLAIVRNKSRKNLRPRASSASLSDLDVFEAPPAEPLEGRELWDLLWRRVSELPEGIREAIFLYYQDGESTRSAARALNVSVPALKSRLQKGREILRKKLWREVEDSLRDLLPSTREWKRRGRGMALLVLASLPAASSVHASAVASHGLLMNTTQGGIIVTAKKVYVSAALALVLMIGSVVFILERGRGSRDEGAGGPSTPLDRAALAPPPSSSTEGAARKLARAPGDPARALEAIGEAAPVSLHGRVTHQGGGVRLARVLALDVAAWNRVGEDENRRSAIELTDPSSRLKSLRDAYLERAKGAPETRSGDDGTFAFRGLGDGDYRILVLHPDFLPNGRTLASVRTGTPARADIALVPGAVISGRVLDGEGRPLGGAVVSAEASSAGAVKGLARLELLRDAWREGMLVAGTGRAESAEDGSFRLTSLEPVPYDVKAKKAGYLEARAWQVPAGSRDETLKLERGGAVVGRVVDPLLRGVPAKLVLTEARIAEVHKLFDSRTTEVDADLSSTVEAIAGEDGRFRFDGLEEGPRDLTATAEGHPSLRREVEVGDGTVDLGDLKLEESLAVSGSVHGPDGRPIGDARVWVPKPLKRTMSGNSTRRDSDEAVAETRSGPEGLFHLTGLSRGVFEVRASTAEHADASVSGIKSGARDVRLQVGTGITVEGKVLDDATGAAVAGADITIGFSSSKKGVSGPDGAFEVRGLAWSAIRNGATVVRAVHPDFGEDTNYNATVIGRDQRSPLILRLARPEMVTGRISDAGGEPIANARILYEVEGLSPDAMDYNPARGLVAFSAADGTFALEAPSLMRSLIQVPTLHLRAFHPSFAPGRSGPVLLPATGESWGEFSIVLEKGSTIEGAVRDADGRPIAGVLVRALESGAASGEAAEMGLSSRGTPAYSGQDGRYRVSGVPGGPLVLEASAIGRSPRRLDLVIEGSGPLHQDIVLEAGASITGRVADSTGAPLGGAEVVALAEGEGKEADEASSEFIQRMSILLKSGSRSARTALDGRYTLSHLPEGELTVLARAVGYEAAVAPAVRAGGTAPDLLLSRYSALRGTVSAADTREAVTLFTIDVLEKKKLEAALKPASKSGRRPFSDYRTASEGELRFQDPAGRFFYDGLRPGEYLVIIQAPGFVTVRREAAIGPGEEAPLDVTLERGTRVEGVVLDSETGLPVAGASVRCFRRGGSESFQIMRNFLEALTADDGTFAIAGLTEGTYSFGADHPTYLREHHMPAEIEIPAAPGTRIELKLSPAGRLEGRIRGLPAGKGGKRSVTHRLDLEKLEPGDGEGEEGRKQGGFRGFQQVYMDPEGRYSANNLLPGLYRLSLTSQEVEMGEVVHVGPTAGFGSNKPVGPEQVLPLGDVEIRARETTVFDAVVP